MPRHQQFRLGNKKSKQINKQPKKNTELPIKGHSTCVLFVFASSASFSVTSESGRRKMTCGKLGRRVGLGLGMEQGVRIIHKAVQF